MKKIQMHVERMHVQCAHSTHIECSVEEKIRKTQK